MKRMVDALGDETFDVVILGGGITGAGVALDAALRGWRVALIDKGDFASGTSSASSKLIHGGLRYLEQGALPLVHEALRERGLLLRNAPHLVRPLRFFLPFYRGSRIPPWKWRLGLTVYDFLAGRDNIRRSRPLERRALERHCPRLRRAGLEGGAEFYDAQMDDARLCIEVLGTAFAHGARLANYVEAAGFEKDAGLIRAIRAVDKLSGQTFDIRTRLVLNATGPWVDAVCRLAGEEGDRLQPTKGVHIVLPSLSLPGGLLLMHPADGRVFFVLPWMGKTLVGTTDTFAASGQPTVDEGDIAYLLAGFNHHFEPGVAPSEVLGSFVGLRPLLSARAHEQPSSLSREFSVWQGPSGLVSVAGGKYTTYRYMAEVITDRLGQLLGKRQRCRTHRFPLLGTPSEPWEVAFPNLHEELMRTHGLTTDTASHLLHRYGCRAELVARFVSADPAPLIPGEQDSRGEHLYQKEHEMAVLPADHFLRRSWLGLYHPELLAPQRDCRAESTESSP